MKYRKKPIVIEAEQYFPGKPLPKGVRSGEKDHRLTGGGWCGVMEPHVDTLEGPLHVSPGDWIIAGIAGEIYPCKDKIFKKTYEKVEE